MQQLLRINGFENLVLPLCFFIKPQSSATFSVGEHSLPVLLASLASFVDMSRFLYKIG